jgi:hypothetical protein
MGMHVAVEEVGHLSAPQIAVSNARRIVIKTCSPASYWIGPVRNWHSRLVVVETPELLHLVAI